MLKNMLNTFKWLLWKDIREIFRNYLSNLIDATFLPATLVLLFSNIFPKMGMSTDYGHMFLIGTLSGMAMWSTSSQSAKILTDITGVKSINYELTLPIYSYLIYIKYALSYTIKTFFMSIFIIPIGILILRNIDFTQISTFKFIFAYISMTIFYGFFTLFISISVKDIDNFGRFWMRWGWLIFNLAGSQFSWFFMYKSMPNLAIINLLNPLLYITESLRAAFLGQQNYINYNISILIIWISIIIFALLGIRKFKNRLDLI